MGLDINIGDLLALAQISHCRLFRSWCDEIGRAAAGATAVEPEHETRLLLGAAVKDGNDTERAVRALEQAWRRGHERKAGTPHQGTIAEHPQLSHVRRQSSC